MDTRELRNCLGRFATGVTVVTMPLEEDMHGITVNSFTSVSLDPPLVLVSIDRRAASCRYLENSPFTVNVLRADQEQLALHFAGWPQEGLVVKWERGEFAPRLSDSLAYLECSPWRAYDGGDHVLYLGRVENISYSDGEPLLFYRGRFERLVHQG